MYSTIPMVFANSESFQVLHITIEVNVQCLTHSHIVLTGKMAHSPMALVLLMNVNV
jgi:hypothetical protein